jgi:hypothetical protein
MMAGIHIVFFWIMMVLSLVSVLAFITLKMQPVLFLQNAETMSDYMASCPRKPQYVSA